MTHAESIEAAIEALCKRAAVDPDDGSAAAGLAVARVWEKDGVFADRTSICPLASWLKTVTGLNEVFGAPFVLFGARHIVLWYGRADRDGNALVPLPNAVAAAAKRSVPRQRGGAMVAPTAPPKPPPKRRGPKRRGPKRRGPKPWNRRPEAA